MASYNSSFQNYNAWARYKTPTPVTWGGGGNTTTITDANIHPNSQLEVWVTGSTPAGGQWAYAVTQGQCVITSSVPENSTLTLSYIIF